MFFGGFFTELRLLPGNIHHAFFFVLKDFIDYFNAGWICVCVCVCVCKF